MYYKRTKIQYYLNHILFYLVKTNAKRAADQRKKGEKAGGGHQTAAHPRKIAMQERFLSLH